MQVVNNNNMSIRKALSGDWLVVILLFFSVTTLFFHYYEIFAILPVFLLLTEKKKSAQCKRYSILLLIFGIFYTLSFFINGGISSRSNYLSYLFPPIFYMVGSYLGRKYKNHERVLIFILFTMLVMYVARDMINLYQAINTGGTFIIDDRMIYDEQGHETRSATGYAIVMSVMLVGFALIFTPKQKGTNRWIRISSIILAIIALLGMLALVTRTSVVESLVMLLISVYMMFTDLKKNKGSVGFLIGFIIIILLAYYLLEISEMFQLRDAYQNRLDADDSFAGNRSGRWLAAIRDVLLHPFGTASGRLISDGSHGYAHNMWLDVGLRGGWIPFVVLLLITIKNILHSFKLWRDHSYDYFTRLYFFALMVMFVIGCFVEPVLGAVYNHFLVYLVFCGMVSEMKPKKGGAQPMQIIVKKK